ncbi:MAG: c-type cytochrome [Terracidiphilus sp.]
MQTEPNGETHRVKPTSKLLLAISPASVLCFILAMATEAQSPGARSSAADNPQIRPSYPIPRNLKVLPHDLSGQQVHEIMEQWGRSLGVRCDSCHADATETSAADDKSQLNYADDSKPLKAVSRAMYRMTETINANYIANIENSGIPVTCGTCHRGHIGPEPYDGPPVKSPPQPPLTSSSITPPKRTPQGVCAALGNEETIAKRLRRTKTQKNDGDVRPQ